MKGIQGNEDAEYPGLFLPAEGDPARLNLAFLAKGIKAEAVSVLFCGQGFRKLRREIFIKPGEIVLNDFCVIVIHDTPSFFPDCMKIRYKALATNMAGRELPMGYSILAINWKVRNPAAHAIRAVMLKPLEYQYSPPTL